MSDVSTGCPIWKTWVVLWSDKNSIFVIALNELALLCLHHFAVMMMDHWKSELCWKNTTSISFAVVFFVCRIQISQTVLCPIKSVTNSLLQLHQIATGCLQVGKAAWFTDNDQEVHRFAWLEVLCFLEFSLLLKQRVSMSSLSWVWTAPASIIEVRILLWSVFSDRSMLEKNWMRNLDGKKCCFVFSVFDWLLCEDNNPLMTFPYSDHVCI